MAGVRTGISGQINNNIVTDGLVFYIDPAYKISYPGTGTSVENTIFSSTGTMSATGMFDTSNQGTFVFDGAGDNIDFADNSTYDITDATSVFGWMYVTLELSAKSILSPAPSNTKVPWLEVSNIPVADIVPVLENIVFSTEVPVPG
jgi:hypothetical protein